MPKPAFVQKTALGMAVLSAALILILVLTTGPDDYLLALIAFLLLTGMIYTAINFSINLILIKRYDIDFPKPLSDKVKLIFCPFDIESKLKVNSNKQQTGTRSKDMEIQELKRNEKFRREFIGNISHELKTPVFNIEGYVHSLIDGGIDDDKVNMNYLKKAAVNLDRLNNILRDLDTITYLESGKSELELLCFNIWDLITDVAESLNLLAENYDIHVELNQQDKQPVFVIADKERIRQVLTNLLSNSIKYGSEGGKTEIQVAKTKDNVIIRIADNGIGISKKHLPRLFERFYRVDKSRSRNRGGTGLGLAIVKHIIEAHQQKITVQSNPGEGTTFEFTLKKG
jgi:two-component system, OmpR family, phosphate regulon sensor histidine kinase PhoR